MLEPIRSAGLLPMKIMEYSAPMEKICGEYVCLTERILRKNDVVFAQGEDG